MYQNDTLQLIQHEEGRIVPKAGGWDYQYHLRDHLGNVRVTFSTRPEVYEMTEDFEGGENGFASLHPHTHLAANTTTDGNKVERLQSGQIGAMTFLSVNKGDSINLNVNANYETTPSGNGWLETAHSVLFNALNTSYGEVIEGGVATSEWSDALNGVQMSPKHETSDAPRAFLNYILFDQDMNYVTAGFEQLSTAAHGVGVHETLSMDGIVAEQEGYILAYLSNENAEPVNVHFDDFTVTQTKTRVVSSQDYYPFGGTFNSFTRNYSEPQRFKYNGKELEEETGWSDFGARQYDRWSGRWMGMDPLGDLRSWVSPYNFVQNNPINRVDPDGALDREIRSLTAINRVERIDGEEMMDNPIYNEDGNFLGTDDKGLQGEAIVMNAKEFTQGMSHEKALENNLGVEGLSSDAAKTKLLDHYNGLKDRPDWDGYLTLSEANEWYRNGNGQPLFADLSKVDLSGIYSLGESYVGQTKNFNLLLNSNSLNDGLVYGQVKFKRYPNHHVRAYADNYDFEMHNPKNPLNWPRNVATLIGRKVAGEGQKFEINLYGSKQLTPLFPWIK